MFKIFDFQLLCIMFKLKPGEISSPISVNFIPREDSLIELKGFGFTLSPHYFIFFL